VLTIEDALAHLGIDYTDDVVRRNVNSALEDARSYLRGAVGDDIYTYLPDDHRVDRLEKCYLTDLYEERGTSAKEGNATRNLIASMELQLRLELARAREAAGVGV
jgi:hypothetical protein